MKFTPMLTQFEQSQLTAINSKIVSAITGIVGFESLAEIEKNALIIAGNDLANKIFLAMNPEIKGS